MARHAHRALSRFAPRALSIPADEPVALTHLDTPSLVKRSPADTTSSAPAGTKSCGPNDTTGICTRPVSSTTTMTLPIVLGAVIPITCAFLAFFFLHRRHVKKLRQEDANDKHKSLDFGLDYPSSGNKNKKSGNSDGGISMAEKPNHQRGHGISIDLTMNSPYLLPPGLHGSRESIHSLSRSFQGEGDKYRPATSFTPGDGGSVRSYSPTYGRRADDASSYTSPSSKYPYNDDMNQNLLKNAQRMSRSPPIIQTDPVEADIGASSHSTKAGTPVSSPLTSPRAQGELTVPTANTAGNDFEKEESALRKSNNYLGALIQRGDAKSPENHLDNVPLAPRSSSLQKEEKPQGLSNADQSKSIPIPESALSTLHVKSQAPRISLPLDDDKSDYGDDSASLKRTVPQVTVHDIANSPQNDKKETDTTYDIYDDYYDEGYQVDTRRLTVGIRPLPPEDPSDNAEQRANRIRSFYKEYFDDSKPQEDYYEDYGPEATGYGAYGERADYGHARPFAQPEGRRAMTPPPRMPPIPSEYRRRPAFGPLSDGSRSVAPSVSSGPRAGSSASNQLPGGRRKKPLAPPAPLQLLPTPHKLKDESIMPIDFAPGARSRERRDGRCDTPTGGLQPYMLTVPAHVPLASSYDDLALLPSPHALRKSGTFTALDFVPPSRFKNSDASDTGSIRSNRTGISAAQAYSIRTGAYRISRLPPQTVGTKEDIMSNLHPTWDMKT
ncbi:hypothetical protein LOZ53_004191 [Ophidiomyces ophidiicola]|nr:hypothetical protein LOZ55_006570 [Ophidiomyces ophidiicola]KAI1979234.1 hypothetical protein LOZ54_006117 [Ophidiomyces ophidiicola]KAI1983945.1 hypothetical protein LOZ51_006769 [Ophidiomyces ophidiicola]KAI1987741.1 hypothetical protein LOZ53_004191 [Ophidiomyces ophidiicola]